MMVRISAESAYKLDPAGASPGVDPGNPRRIRRAALNERIDDQRRRSGAAP
jgi:hypothetical protein